MLKNTNLPCWVMLHAFYLLFFYQSFKQFGSFLSLYTARPSFEYYRQVFFVHSGLQDESLQVTISKLPKGSLTCTGDDFPCAGDIQLTSGSEGRCTYLASSLQMTLEKACSIISHSHMHRERSGSVVECLIRDRGAAGLSLTGATALCP